MSERRPLYTPAARDDLRGIGLWMARDNPARAASFVAELREHCRRVAARPPLHRPREEFGPGVRAALHPPYLILTSIQADGRVVIERVLHGARDLRGLVGP